MAEFLDCFPRYAKMHPCGVVLSRQPMHELTPTFISQKGHPPTHFGMDAVEAIGLVMIDILAQGGLAAMRGLKAMLRECGVEVDRERFVAADVRRPVAEENEKLFCEKCACGNSENPFSLTPTLPWGEGGSQAASAPIERASIWQKAGCRSPSPGGPG